MAEATVEVEVDQEKVDEYWEYMLKNYERIYQELWERTVDKMAGYAIKAAKNTIDAFYNDYPERKYDAMGDLYNAIDIDIRDGWMLTIRMGHDLMQYKHHQSNLFVYNNSFVEGYHGGSWGIDKNGQIAAVPYYRTPPFFDEWFDAIGPAPKSPSPRETFLTKINNYNRKTFIPYQKREFAKIISEIIDKLGE